MGGSSFPHRLLQEPGLGLDSHRTNRERPFFSPGEGLFPIAKVAIISMFPAVKRGTWAFRQFSVCRKIKEVKQHDRKNKWRDYTE